MEDLSPFQHCDLVAWRGSVAHGTFVPSDDPRGYDDLDLIACAIPPRRYYVGVSTWGSRGTREVKEDPWDMVMYEHRKFLSLLEKGNPNVLTTLFMDRDFYLSISEAGEVLLEDGPEIFATRRAYPAFRGYAASQGKKMFSGEYQGYMGKKRKELFDEFGYDVKQASHYLRILRQGIEFLDTGRMVVDRREAGDAEELVEVKRGERPISWVKREAARLEAELELAGDQSPLPDSPPREAVDALAVEMWDLVGECELAEKRET